jgi:DNA-binding transcriptional MocR family regulator
VNRDTVALAYETLAAQGVVDAQVGRGTFVRRRAEDAEARACEVGFAPLVERLLDHERARPPQALGADSVPLHALVPDPSLYPVAPFRRAMARALAEGGASLLVYGGAQGYEGLREVLAEHLSGHGVRVGAHEIVLCQGASQGISLALRLFAGSGDAVAVEEPTYQNVLGALIALGLKAVPVPMTSDGPDLDVLDRVLARPEVKLFYTIPTFHNPLGATSSLTQRRALLAVARRHGKPVVEDAFEMDLRFEGRPVPPLAALDESDLVVQLITFSKSLFPGVRAGALIARGRAIEALLALVLASDLGGAPPLQAALAEFLRSGAYERHLAVLRRALRGRFAAAHESLAAELPEDARWTRPEGGYQIWLELPGGLDSREVHAAGLRAGVLVAPGHQFYHDRRPSSCVRLSLALADEASIRLGVARLGALVRERLGASRTARAASAHI